MKLSKYALVLVATILLSSCATTYRSINPQVLNYNSSNTDQQVTFQYKYNILSNRYNKKEDKKNVRLIAVKITNDSEKDLKFGEDLLLSYENGNHLHLAENNKIFSSLKQNVGSYLFYLLLTPLQLYVPTEGGGTKVIPFGLGMGPGIAGGNMILASSSNKKFKNDLRNYDLTGRVIKKGETVHGLVGFISNGYDAIKLNVKQIKQDQEKEEKNNITASQE